MNNLPGSSASFPANIRAPSGEEYRTTPVINRPFQDCADRTAYLYSRTVSRTVNTIADMQALTGLEETARVNVAGLGTYVLDGSHSYGEVVLFIYEATGMGTGWYWVHESRLYLFGNSDGFAGLPMKIEASYIPNRLVDVVDLQTAGLISQTVTAGATTNLTNGSVVISGLIAGDTIEGTIGPLYVGGAHTSGWAYLQLNSTQTATYVVTRRQVLASSAHLLSYTFKTTAAASGNMTLFLSGIAAASGTLSVQSFDDLAYSIGTARIWRA